MKIKILSIFIVLFLVTSSFIVTGINITNGSLKTPIEEPSGFIKWDKIYNTERYDIGNCIQQTNDGGYICVGEGDGYKVWLFKTNEIGTIEWSKFFEHGWPDYGRYVLQTEDNGYLVLAETELNDFEHVWLIKIDENGNKIWERFHRYKKESSGYCIQPTYDGGYIIAGYASPLNWLNCYDFWLLNLIT